MNAHERRPLDAAAAERMLSGHPAARRGSGQLAQRLVAVSTPAFPGELAGEEAAVAAFLAAASGTPVAPLTGRKSMLKSAVVAKLLSVKAAAVAITAVSAGGVALAATTGVIPNPLAPQNPGHSSPASDDTHGSDATPSPSLDGLCTAYLAEAGADHGKALENPAFTVLITAAGGADQVGTFCAERGVTAPGSERGAGSPTGQPSHPGPTDHPTGPPAGEPTDHPTGEPTHPTGAPTSHPSS